MRRSSREVLFSAHCTNDVSVQKEPGELLVGGRRNAWGDMQMRGIDNTALQLSMNLKEV